MFTPSTHLQCHHDCGLSWCKCETLCLALNQAVLSQFATQIQANKPLTLLFLAGGVLVRSICLSESSSVDRRLSVATGAQLLAGDGELFLDTPNQNGLLFFALR